VAYLNREIRYTGIEFDRASIIPHMPSETLEHRYGDCKDKATLLVALLRSLDIPANVALLAIGDRLEVPIDQPGLGLFDHAIVYVPGNPSTGSTQRMTTPGSANFRKTIAAGLRSSLTRSRPASCAFRGPLPPTLRTSRNASSHLRTTGRRASSKRRSPVARLNPITGACMRT